MKYVLRIIIVLAMIVGIVFGVRYCINKKSSEVQFQQNVQECINVQKQIVSGSEEFKSSLSEDAINFINDRDYDLYIINLSEMQGELEHYLGEIYFLKNASNSSLNEINNIAKSLTNYSKTYLEKCNTMIKIIKANENVNQDALNNLSSGIVNVLSDFRYEFAKFCKFTMEQIKEQVRNGVTDTNFDNTLNQFDNLIKTYGEGK